MTLILFLLLLVAIAVIVALLRRKPVAPVPPSPYARDDAFGRPDPPWRAGYPQQPGPTGMPGPSGGLGSAVAGGLAAGLAMGAGAVAAQEIGRRMFEHGHEGAGHAAADAAVAPHADQSQSQIARDAGVGDIDPGHAPQGLQDFGDAGWDDAGGGFDDGGGWDT